MSEASATIDLRRPPTSADPDVVFGILDLQASSYLTEDADRELLSRAYGHAALLHRGAKRDSGEPYITHPLHVALILSHLQLDVETLAAALLHDVLEDTATTHEALEQEFGTEIVGLVEGVTKLTQVSKRSRVGESAANIQKVFVAMSEDLRVIFIKLADRLHNLRTLHSKQNVRSRERTASEALEIYARIADRLGIATLRKEIEDIAFSYLDPGEYERVRSSIARRYEENADRVETIQRELLALLRENGIRPAGGGVKPNPRRVYDMFRRLQEEQNLPPGKAKRVPPLLRFHVIVEDVLSCYMAMAAIHARWPPIASETRDYISAPLSNGYQSVHTTVVIDRQPIKFQIRTLAMHRMSQMGIAAHMREGEWPASSPALKRTVDEIRRFSAEAVREFSDPVEFLATLKAEELGDEVYVYTPLNEVIKLPAGATSVDFAYRIHTDVGHRCRGSLVDGHWVALNRPLRTGEHVEILTVDGVGPCYEWLSPDLGYTKSPLAKTKIRRWFRRRPDETKIAMGRRELRRIVDRLALDVSDFSALVKRTAYSSEQELFREIGGCDLPIERILPELFQVYGEPHLPTVCSNDASNIPVTGIGSLEKRFATCCHPQPGDDLVGYLPLSQHGLEVHCSDCPVFLSKMVEDKARFVGVRWGRASETYLACMAIYAHDRPFLLRDVWNIISDEGINVSDVEVRVNRARDAAITICVDVENWLQLNCIMARIEDLPGAIRVRRQETPVT